MKKILSLLFLAALTVGLLGSCSKINERIDSLEKRIDGIESTSVASVQQQISAINQSITDLKAADETIGGKIGDLKTTAEALQTLIDALKEADKALVQKDEALEARIATLEGQVAVINGQIKTLEEADKAINTRIDELKSYIDKELGNAKDWASATFATLEEYRKTAAELATLSVTVSGISNTLAAVQTSITTLDTKIDGIDAALQGKIADAKMELEGKISSLKTELEGKITEAISTSEDNLKGWVNEQLSGYYTIAQTDAKIKSLQDEIDILNTDNETNKNKIAELETKLNNLSAELTQAKATIKTEYEAAIAAAITEYDGTITQTINQKIAEVNATITALTARVETLETTVGILSGRIDAAEASINTINQQIAAINQSIADLETIRTNIQTLMDAKTAMGEDIAGLKAADQALEGKINELKTYVDTELAKYATTDWVNGTFATLEKQEEIIADVTKLKQDLDELDAKLDQSIVDLKAELDQSIADLETSLQGWVNEQLSGYYTIAEIDVIIAGLQDEIDILNASDAANKTKIAELETKLNNFSAELTQAKATIKAEYEAAIKKAIENHNGEITQTINQKIAEVNATIAALTARVETLETTVGILSGRIDAAEASINTINQQIAAINQSISDLETIRTNIQALIAAKNAMGEDIAKLKEADITLEGKINDLKTYVDTELAKYATTDWVNGTFATLEKQEEIIADVTKLKQDLDELDAKLDQSIVDLKAELDQSIADLETSLQGWVNEQLEGYYTIAEIDVKIKSLQDEIDILNTDNETNKTKIAELETKLNNFSAELTQAKATIKAEYEAAIKKAIEDNNGIITQTINQKIAEVNATITALTARVETLETTVGVLSGRIDAAEASINTINQQIAAINQSIADLETIRTNIQTLMDAKTAMGEDIAGLKAADQALEGKINELKTYVDTELAKYATTDWVNGTFATLEKQEEIIADVTKLKQDLDELDAKLDQSIADLKAELDQSIADLETSLQGWVNEKFTAYYTTAQMDTKIADLKSEIDDLETKIETNQTDIQTNKNKIAELAANLTQLTQALEEAKTTIKTEYEAAIAAAITEYDGTITQTINQKIAEVNATIAALTGRVETLEAAVSTLQADVAALKAMIQSVTIIPAYNDGSVEAVGGILYLDIIVEPADAVKGLTKDNLTVLVNEVKTKAASYTTLNAASATVDETTGNVTITADISGITPAEGKALTVALNVRNGISDFTTGFVVVTTVVKAPTFKAVYDTNGGANTLTFYYDAVDHSGEGITVYEGSTGEYYLFDGTKSSVNLWGYNGNRGNVKSVVIDASVAGYSGLTTTSYMFQGMKNATSISGAEYLDVSNVTDMSFMFQNFGGGNTNSHTTLNSVPNVSGWNTGNVTNMTAMFESYGNFSDNLAIVPDVSNWNTGNVTDMTFMFQKYGHESQTFNAVPDVSKWNTGNVMNMANMFMEYGHKSTSLNTVPNVSGWNTGKVTNMKQMFNNYGSTSENISCVLDLSGWDLSKITGTNGVNVFNFAPKTFNVKIPEKTGEKANETDKWYYGDGTGYITPPPSGKTFTLPAPPLPAGALSGEFTVNEGGKKVHFSQGNLTYNVSTTTWAFYEHQYDCATAYDANLISHFNWGYDATKSIVPNGQASDNVSRTSGNLEQTEDWGCTIGDGNTWRTLTKDEWTYLFNTRTMTYNKSRYSNAVNGVTIGGTTYKGVFIYPDNYNGDVVSNSMTWDQINAAGIVFLPAAGYRNGSNVSYVGDRGLYWSSSAFDSDYAYYVCFYSLVVTPADKVRRSRGFSVRLVTEVPAAGDPGNGTEQYTNNSNPDWFSE